ncbi:Chloramphenicol acetyltransferase-like domain protein [Niveomyces insectorum RCEF 264]|uniref:Chloramphenicol acetyltransferase-like domain protein n=1 Tax=Niveomyces insectorum RCEF 264 TaxID=1081102 RepID=A0A167SK66_9HYPO|nr:Chloramphenicol acetyltransferase-like domain protein [Niveomyces insectorum RCEF 264]
MANSADYGRRLIPQILDELAVAEPNRVLYSVAVSQDISQGFQTVSARTFAKAVDKTAWLLRGQIEDSPTIQSVGYIGPHDLRHVLLTYACVKINCTALFLSPKNSTEGALAVLEAAKCNIWVNPDGKSSRLVDEVLQKRPMNVLGLPSLDELLDAEATEPYPYEKAFADAIAEPFCVLHTSGSTGLPKPIVWSHGLIGTMDAVRLLPPTEGDGGMAPWSAGWDDGDRIYSSFPMSHGAGIIMNILLPSLFRLHCVMGPASVIPNLNLIDSLAEHGKIDIWSMIPSLVDELGEAPDILPKLASSKFICASGGPVSPISGSKVNSFVRVLNLTGTTEGLFIGNLWVPREDWFYFAFHPYSGFEFKEVEPGIYEHWVHRNEHAPLFQGIFHTFPDEKSINLKDLYVKHPTKANFWSYHGRNDDIVVLSNGYKISPLDTEALVTTHPAIEGCLMIGSGKPQAGLLIELKDPSSGSDELFESIWATVEKANALSLHKNQLLKDYIAFSEPNKPFIRTDKRTVKRRATLALYADYIERFYSSRLDDDAQHLATDTSSAASTTQTIRRIVESLLPDAKAVSPDEDLFRLGLDSLLVFRAIKSIRVATGLGDKLSTRHLYANPTLAKFSEAVIQLLEKVQKTAVNGASPHDTPDPVQDKLRQMMDLHKSRLSQKANPCDLMNPNIYVGMKFYIPLGESVSFEQAYARLQRGLRRTIDLIPALEGKVMPCSEHEMGYKRGDLRITLPPLPSTATADVASLDASREQPRQLRYKDLSNWLPSYEELRAAGFLSSVFKDEVFTDCPWFPPLPADVLYAQANFVKGGCILTLNVHHAAFDGVGAITALRVWAECCRYDEGDPSATCSWLDPESLNRDMLHILYELEGYAKPAHEVDPNVWGFLGFPNPADLANGHNTAQAEAAVDERFTTSALPAAPPFPRKFAWPPTPPADGRQMVSSTFLIPPQNVEKLRQTVLADPDAKGLVTSISDMVQAFFWRAAIRARYRVATELRGESFGPDDMAIVEMPIDARPYFSSLLPSSYMGSCLVTNRPYMPVAELCAPDTSLGRIAYLFREAATRITPALVHDAFTLLQSVPDYSMLTNACMGLEGMHLMMNNLMLFQTSDISFGGEFFANAGVPDTVRIQMDRFNTAFRLLLIHPIREDGGIELLLGTLPEEFNMLVADEEFSTYAEFMG